MQSEGSAAIANAYFAGKEEIIPVSADTIADSISVDLPRDGIRAVRAATQTGGQYLTVKDDAIVKAMGGVRAGGLVRGTGRSDILCRVRQSVGTRHGFNRRSHYCFKHRQWIERYQHGNESSSQAPVIQPTMSALKQHLENYKEY